MPILINTLLGINESKRERSAYGKWCLHCNLYFVAYICVSLIRAFYCCINIENSIQHSTQSMSVRLLYHNFMDLLDASIPILSFVCSFVRRFLYCCSSICHFVNCNAILCTHLIHYATENRWENRHWMNKSWKIEINANDSTNRTKVEWYCTFHVCGRQTEEENVCVSVSVCAYTNIYVLWFLEPLYGCQQHFCVHWANFSRFVIHFFLITMHYTVHI